jgi:hypothetical protein
MVEGVNLTKIYCKNFCKCCSVSQYNNNKIKNLKKEYMEWNLFCVL